MPDKEQYVRLVCLFLAEQLRVKKIDLKRAAEIGQKVLDNVNLLDSEHDFLHLIKELSKDFEELQSLQERVYFWTLSNQRKTMEDRVRNFAVQIMGTNPNAALSVILAAIQEDVTLEKLQQQFPDFSQYLVTES
ncbi:MAG: hypothetical protein A3H72_03765 [Candidatus Doudnabacteria bacterium RIFCSPLOWO2_02_FULL_48_8]|uniref:Uncharacterized protein n=1 Tax=Candidatus Doudnabacteria bacterium RIFCSPHIGHO2_01_FULL_46_24 TaxID=1817825 RepID=A0A1F5NUM6_9BACT|nr:MAG: hypothetical protein A2720_02410 [Candidatus Doudnabacteria bacterium RIFCSPHIGHO2_01_FULL_46_24]OGE94203.1 MAG: hypothetical protein A3E98_00045 [Candidatus Doudnabacteria bacterium RIFCSPHIGHO2_12_FULL_48_11]OGE95331.1 MAG: hypothetical protein A3H72_03765 [Candidatus Doudnabacteria bacterium RIFCSPLOWO2_02_FULL_48_8]